MTSLVGNDERRSQKLIKKLLEGVLLKDFDDKVRIVDIDNHSTATKGLCWILETQKGLFREI